MDIEIDSEPTGDVLKQGRPPGKHHGKTIGAIQAELATLERTERCATCPLHDGFRKLNAHGQPLAYCYDKMSWMAWGYRHDGTLDWEELF